MLRKEYASRLDETIEAVDVWESLVQDDLGGSHQYASPAGRATEALDSKAVEALALSGSTDPMTLEQAGLQTYLVAANHCVVNARLLAAFAREADDGPSREAMRRAAGTLESTADAHVQWATTTLE
nr:hypothetical protein [Micromonospora sp. DSM 115978]